MKEESSEKWRRTENLVVMMALCLLAYFFGFGLSHYIGIDSIGYLIRALSIIAFNLLFLLTIFNAFSKDEDPKIRYKAPKKPWE